MAAMVGLAGDGYISYRPRVGDSSTRVRDRFKDVPEHIQLARIEAARAKQDRKKQARLHRRDKSVSGDWRFR